MQQCTITKIYGYSTITKIIWQHDAAWQLSLVLPCHVHMQQGRKGPCYVDITGNGCRPCCVHITGTDLAPAVLISNRWRNGPCCVHMKQATDVAPAVLRKRRKGPAVFILKKRKGPCCVHVKKTEKHKILSTVLMLILRWNVIKITASQLEYPKTTPLVLLTT